MLDSIQTVDFTFFPPVQPFDKPDNRKIGQLGQQVGGRRHHQQNSHAACEDITDASKDGILDIGADLIVIFPLIQPGRQNHF